MELTDAARALRNSELKYRRLHESITDAVVSVNMSGQILETNPAYQTMLGYTAEELRRLRYQDLTPDPWHEIKTQDRGRADVDERAVGPVAEKEYRRRDGRCFRLRCGAIFFGTKRVRLSECGRSSMTSASVSKPRQPSAKASCNTRKYSTVSRNASLFRCYA